MAGVAGVARVATHARYACTRVRLKVLFPCARGRAHVLPGHMATPAS